MCFSVKKSFNFQDSKKSKSCKIEVVLMAMATFRFAYLPQGVYLLNIRKIDFKPKMWYIPQLILFLFNQNFFTFCEKGGTRQTNREHIPMDDVYYVVPGPEDQADGEEPKVYVSTTQGLKKVVERRHSQNSDR